MDLDALTRRQQLSLWLDGREGLHSVAESLAFMEQVALALRYGAGSGLPLASMYRATQRQVPVAEDERAAHARAFELTNELLATGSVIEVNLFANRLCLVHARVMPAIYALRRGAAEPVLSETAREAFDFIVGNRTATSGDIRRLLKAEGHVRPDPADLALAELQRELLVDRGPSSSPGQGVFYLSREGYPYRAFAPAHPDFISSAALLSRSQAGVEVVKAYLAAAVVVSHRQLAKLFELVLSSAEVDDTIDMLRREGLAHSERQGRQVFIWFGGRVPSPGSL